MKNICLIVDTLGGTGGTEKVVISLAQALSKLNCNVDVITLNDQKSRFPLGEFDFNIHSIQKIKHPIKFIQAYKQVKLLKQLISDIGVNFDLFVSNSTYDAFVCKLAKLYNIFYVIHNSIGTQYRQETSLNELKQHVKPPYTKIIRLLIRKFLYRVFIANLYNKKNLITVSIGVKQDLLKFGIRPNTIQTIYNPFDSNNIRLQSEMFSVEEDDYIIHVGRFDTHKRHDVLINAYKKSGIKQKLLLLGNGNKNISNKIKRLVFDLNIQNKVVFKGFVPNPYPYIKKAKALVLSSDQEGFGLVLVESLILDTQIVSTNCISGPGEILVDELSLFLSPIRDIEALSNNIRKAIDSPIKITKKYTEKFSAEKSARQYLSL